MEIDGPLEPGRVLFGRYALQRQLGAGGMGPVWLVRHLELDAPRALKLIAPGAGIRFDPETRERFHRGVRAMARLAHPNAVAIYDARMEADAAFIEMEYVPGQGLDRLMSAGVPMPLDWIARVVGQLCDVLQEAHDRKIVHRNLKPSDLMLVEGRPPGKELLKVLDFGVAEFFRAESEAEAEAEADVRTAIGDFLGPVAWLSPEQVIGGEVDGRSDLYSVGIILYELLTGSRPFRGMPSVPRFPWSSRDAAANRLEDRGPDRRRVKRDHDRLIEDLVAFPRGQTHRSGAGHVSPEKRLSCYMLPDA